MAKSKSVPTSMRTGLRAVRMTIVPGTNDTFAYYIDREDGTYHLTHCPTGVAAFLCASRRDTLDVAAALYGCMGKFAESTDMTEAATLVPFSVRAMCKAACNVAAKLGANIEAD